MDFMNEMDLDFNLDDPDMDGIDIGDANDFDPLDSLGTHQGAMLDDILDDADDSLDTYQGDLMEEDVDVADGSLLEDAEILDDDLSTYQGSGLEEMAEDDGIGAAAERAGDPTQEMYDTDGDGIADTIYADTDGNGIVDTMVSVDADGTLIKMYDYNQDGQIDAGDCYVDLDGDGVYDMVVDILDTDHDGTADTARTYVDLDGDLQADIEYTSGFDPETMLPGQLGETVIETDAVVDLDADDDQVLLDQGADLDIEVMAPQGGSQFSPAAADMDKVVGDPLESMEYWEYQGPTNRCAIYSQKFVIEELTGQDLDIEDLAQLAEEQNWFSEDGGTSLLHTNKLLNHFGVDNTMSFDNTMSDIEECLANGGKVIVGVNADEIWYGEESNIFVPSGGANHALQVVGVDYTDPDNPQVILNDSGAPDGCGETVPLDVFVGAWEDGNCQMIACYA